MGRQVGPVQVLDSRRLERLVEAEKPSMAVLTVPTAYAQDTAERLGKLGVPAIWNFTSCDLAVEGVLVEQVNFADSLLTLSYRLKQKREAEENPST